VNLSVQKTFQGLYPGPPFKTEGRRAKGWVGLERMDGREWEGKKYEGEGKKGRGGRRKGGRLVKAGAPKLKFWRRHCTLV
jgi:hypothetical protein